MYPNPMSSLPLEPAEAPWTDEYQEIHDARYRKAQAYLGHWENIEDHYTDDECTTGLSPAETNTIGSASSRHTPRMTTKPRSTSLTPGKAAFKCGTGNPKLRVWPGHEKAAPKSGK